MIYVLIGLLIYTGIYYFVLGKQGTKPYSKNYSTPTPQPTTIAQPTTVQVQAIDMSNWKTYTNTKYKYYFKYPVAYTSRRGAARAQTTGDEHSVLVGGTESAGPEYPILYVNTYPRDKSSEDFYNEDSFTNNIDQYISVGVGTKISPPNQPFEETFARLPDENVGNTVAKVFESFSYGGSASPSGIKDRRLIIKKEPYTYMIGGYYISKTDETWELYRKILSTFRFTQ